MTKNLIDKLVLILNDIGVTRIANITGYEDTLVYTFQSVRPNARHLIVDSGKGLDRDSAFISCAVEAIERYVAEEHIDLGISICYEQLPRSVQQSSDKIISCETLKAVKAIEFNSQSTVYLPKQLIDYKNKTSDTLVLKLFFAGSTGLGAHTDMNLAIYSGLIEILERDAIASDHSPSLVNLQSLPREADLYIDWIQKNVGEIELKYHKSKHGIFVFSCSCWNSEVVGGFNSMGASLNKLDALVNCFMEGIQTWLMRISGTRDDWILSMRSLNIKSLSNGMFINYPEISESLSSLPLQQQKIDFLNNFNPLYVYQYVSSIQLDPIKVVRVILPNTSKLEQGEMFTGVPRGQFL